ncbi:MAG: type I DNA topoisomerase [Chloroflexi bacterium]|nr:type I DNA topoisomerase [Chloroflexota bacterium]
MKDKLVIVESPAKTKTLGKLLGKGYKLKASLGHVRDLPKSQLGVDTDDAFTPKYVVPREKSKVVKELKEAVKDASTVFLATDPDREGEAISWHLIEVTKSDHTPYKRVVFHEITKEAIDRAFKSPRELDMQLVNAQQARRVLDRLVGYKISPLLWKKVRRGLSAGRVQSVALKIIVDREREIQQFVSQEYWSIEAELEKQKAAKKESFRASFVGRLDEKKQEVRKEETASDICAELRKASYSVLKVATKKITRHPAPPFITSTLQQEAVRKLHFTASFTMSVAQQLYEGLPIGDEGNVGLITYMRTDSTQVARTAVAEAREFIAQKYGAEYLPPHARTFAGTVKGAQEAHEAIRPTKIYRLPSAIKQYLTPAQFKLYDLIWKRMVASQMAAAIFDSTTVDIRAKGSGAIPDYLLRTSVQVNVFPGFMTVYTESKDDDKESEKTSKLPSLEKGDALNLIDLFPEQHFTQPPPRYTEATLIKALEQYGIGRPSTYAPILSTIQARDYVVKPKGGFQPTPLGLAVNDQLAKYFPEIVNIEFTAHMENDLDKIAEGKRDWESVLREFYTPFEKSLGKASESMERVKIADEITEETCPKCGKPLAIKFGRFGKFLACTGYPECKFTKPFQVKTGVKCPRCGGELVEKISKKKKTFYGCSNYPKCDFATMSRPLSKPCPKCSGLLTQYRGNWARCTQCSYKGKAPEESAKEEKVESKVG